MGEQESLRALIVGDEMNTENQLVICGVFPRLYKYKSGTYFRCCFIAYPKSVLTYYLHFGGGGGAPGFLTPVVSYAPRLKLHLSEILRVME